MGLPRGHGPPSTMEVLWFELPKRDSSGDALRGSIQPGRMVVLIDRDDYWQATYLIPKGAADEVRARGLTWLRAEVERAVPDTALAPGASRGTGTSSCSASRPTA